MWVRPIRESALLDELAEGVVRQFPGRARVIVDGAPPTRPDALAEALVEALRLRGRPVLRVSSGGLPQARLGTAGARPHRSRCAAAWVAGRGRTAP